MFHKVEEAEAQPRFFHQAADGFGSLGNAVGAEQQAHLRKTAGEGRAYLLGHAATHANGDAAAPLYFTQPGDTPKLGVHLLFRLVADGAGIDNVQRGIVKICLHKPSGGEGAAEPVGVVGVHLAAKGLDMKVT